MSEKQSEPLTSKPVRRRSTTSAASKVQKPVPVYPAKTPLGKRLAALRAEAIAEGMQLLTVKEFEKYLAERRGGISYW